MKDEILIKKICGDVKEELENIGFSSDYVDFAKNKYKNFTFKIFELKPAEANILKQTCLSLGFDAAVNRDAVTCKCEFSDAIINGSVYQIEKLCEKLEQQPFRLKKLSKILKGKITPPKFYKISEKKFDYKKPYLMGILNITPDSFSDGGKNFNPTTAIDNALKMVDEGAAIIDIGGESTRPDATPISSEEECRRILPVISELKKSNQNIIISVDTIHPKTIVKAIELGADILNNVAQIEKFEPVFATLKNHKTSIVITHSDTIPPTPVTQDFDGDIVEEIYKFFAKKIQYLKEKGLGENLPVLDVGIGFGKSINDQFELIKRADEFTTLNCPILYGISRKSFIFKTFGLKNRDKITQIYAQHLISKGTNILRVHDVKSHADLIKYLDKIK